METKRRRTGEPPNSVKTTQPSDGCLPADRSEKSLSFKNPNFVHSIKLGATNKRRLWKNLKQILAAEKSLQWNSTDVTYSSIEAPPSFYPAKKYSDISGLPAKYVDPHSKLRYASAEEYSQIKTLPSDIVAGLLQLRKANNVVG
ncbi:INO80 complex subunit C-like [Watersipora subatra]|uniref:INO80 complex subunit C-like n=1 Tax=Watersipora subatra TaxID=2589382 RepID=UPI00355ADA00